MTVANSMQSLSTTAQADDIAVREVRKLVLDCCRQHGGGHGGSAIGMAPLAVALWKYVMRYNSSSPNWFDRDRFVLSNGHAAILLYSMLHVTGHANFTMENMKGYGSPKWKGYETSCFAHPEIEFDGIEITTGPLGQGIANSVGMAIASKQLAATYNKPGFPLIQSKIYCATGDGCLMEGVAIEAMAVAGNMRLDNLIILYDNNAVTCDGPLEWIVSEDVNAKVQAMGWRTIDVFDGDTSVSSIVNAIRLAKTYTGKPTLINIRTTIGYSTTKAGTAAAHHGTFTDADLVSCVGEKSRPTHYVIPEVYEYFTETQQEGTLLEQEWKATLQSYSYKYPAEYRELTERISGKLEYQEIISSIQVPTTLTAAREINGYIYNQLFESIPQMFIGGADLWGANKLGRADHSIFEHSNFSGRVVRYGIREHAMAAISNGIAAYQPGVFIPSDATFLMFYLYAAPGVRMGALNELQVIHVATHDSFQEGQNGPTHQPVEVDSLFRAMPNFQFIRPSDAEEILGAWTIALREPKKSSLISVARDSQVHKPYNTCRVKAANGGYVVKENLDAVVTLISCGSELGYTLRAATVLDSEAIPTRVVSMPCISVFESQSAEYQAEVLGSATRIISVEPYVPTVWARFCTASIGMKSFGYSASGPSNYDRFGIDEKGIVRKVTAYVKGGDKLLKKWILLE
ncbi:Transketolase, thiamine diphosphate binding domain-containing protein [Lipomyces doorenjongii]